MGQPGKSQATLLTPIDVVKADWLSKAGNSKPLTQKTPEKVTRSPVTNNGESPEYIVDPGTKTTYVKGKFLGKGGFARVHELTDLTTGQVYAGKIIPKCRLTKPRQKEKILREIDLHRQLQHRHVVRFHHFFEDEGKVYIILENCPRKSLVHVLRNRKSLTEPEVRHFMMQLAEGVKYIHGQGVIHRDLKLGNMFLSEDMEVKIGDFGLATHVGSINTAGKKFTVCGTPNYIAPEVLNMQGHGFAADVWAMGCIMYAMLVGQPPFETPTLNETYCRITHNKYSIPNSLSDTAKHLIARMLQSKPSERPTLSEIIQHKYFSSGLLPPSLPTSCCIAVPKIPAMSMIARSATVDPVSPDVEKVANCVTALQLSPKSDKKEAAKIHPRNDQFIQSPKKDNCFPTNLRQKLTSVLCPDKAKKAKQSCNTLAMYNMIINSLDSMPTGAKSNPPSVSNDLAPFITKWIDYSNKYGFGFQLSDHSIGVLFNDSTKMSLSADRARIEYHDSCGKMTVHNHSNIPSNLQERYTLLKYFTQYMDENLTEGGELQSKELVRKKISVPHMKRWVRSSYAIVMQLSSGTLQINFFKDHTKIVISGEHPNGVVMYINEDRQSNTYYLSEISQHGCDSSIQSRLQYAAGMLHDFLELEGEGA